MMLLFYPCCNEIPTVSQHILDWQSLSFIHLHKPHTSFQPISFDVKSVSFLHSIQISLFLFIWDSHWLNHHQSNYNREIEFAKKKTKNSQRKNKSKKKPKIVWFSLHRTEYRIRFDWVNCLKQRLNEHFEELEACTNSVEALSSIKRSIKCTIWCWHSICLNASCREFVDVQFLEIRSRRYHQRRTRTQTTLVKLRKYGNPTKNRIWMPNDFYYIGWR